ncbi:MAG: hypothetical protein IPL40_07280 [Proteobacteria bacterium]|nr:hypothetical protein [Pseudomonadota bacterium]
MRWHGLAWVGVCCLSSGLLGACSREGFRPEADARATRDAARADAARRDAGVLPGRDTGLRADGAARDGAVAQRDSGLAEADAALPDATAALPDAAVADAAPADQTPDAFAFAELRDQPLGSIVLSSALPITGFDGTLLASVTGGGSPALRVEGGAWGPTALIRPGQTLQLRLTSSPNVLTTSIAVVELGTARVNWTITTKSGSTRIFTTPGAFSGNLGGLGTAHQHCQLAASTLGYGGIFRALLSTQAIAAKDLLTITYPVVRASDGASVDAVYLWDGNLSGVAVTPVASGGSVPSWTGGPGSDPVSGPGETCNDWRSTTGYGRGGLAEATDAWWLRYTWLSPCSESKRLYCVEQPAALGAVLTITPRAAAMVVAEAGSPGYGKAETFTIENVGDQTSTPLAVSLSNTTSFELTANGCAGRSLASGMLCTVTVRPRAYNGGSFAGTLDVSANNAPQAALSLVAGTLVFRTATTYGGDLGGLLGADAICSAAAAGAGLPGVFMAVLSDATVHAADRFVIRYPVITTNGKVIAGGNFWSQSPENGGALSLGSSTSYVWTGTKPGGTKSTDETCQSWTSSSSADSGKFADTGGGGCSGGSIFNCNPTNCMASRALLCMSQ